MGATTSSALYHRGLLGLEAEAALHHETIQERRNRRRNKRRRNKRAVARRCRPTNYVPREERVRSIVETLSAPLTWPKTRSLPWLVSHKGAPLELDLYNAQLRMAFECDGAHHRRFVRHFAKDREGFEAQKRRDQLKDALCRRYNVTLMRVPPRERLDDSRLVLFLMRRLKRAGFNCQTRSDRPPPREA